jgi:DNA-binding transcriptional MocR family regulator
MKWAMGLTAGDSSRKLVLLALADFADAAGQCFPSLSALVKRTELSRATVQRKLSELRAAGFIASEERLRQDGSRSSNGYVLHIGYTQHEAPRAQDEAGPASSYEAPPASQRGAMKLSVEPSVEQKKKTPARMRERTYQHPRRPQGKPEPVAETVAHLMAKVQIPRA